MFVVFVHFALNRNHNKSANTEGLGICPVFIPIIPPAGAKNGVVAQPTKISRMRFGVECVSLLLFYGENFVGYNLQMCTLLLYSYSSVGGVKKTS